MFVGRRTTLGGRFAVVDCSFSSSPRRPPNSTLRSLQAARPRLQRWLDAVGAVWSKAVVAATLLTALGLPLLGVPFWGDRGALYRAMGVLTAGSPCALALVPLAYVCAIAAVTARGVLVKSGAALDALAGVGTVALDKTGTITAGALTLAEGYVVTVGGGAGGSDGGHEGRVGVRRMDGVEELLLADGEPSAVASPAAGAAAVDAGAFDAVALSCAVALSRLSNHPVSRAVVEAAPGADAGVGVESFAQVPGSGVEGVCALPGGARARVRFGALDWVGGFLDGGSGDSSGGGGGEQQQPAPRSAALGGLALEELQARLRAQQEGRASRAVAFVTVSAADGADQQQQQQQQGQQQRIAMLCFDDVVMPGVPSAVASLRTGAWRRAPRPSPRHAKRVVMLTGDNARVAEAVAAAVGIADFRAALRPEDKLAYVRDAAAAADASEAAAPSGKGGKGSASSTAGGGGGLMMVGDGINDAPALAAAQVGVAIAATPSDMVAAAADLIVLNGRGVTNLPWLFSVAERTQAVLRQNLALALASVAVAALPSAAGLLPLWLAVTLHEGATLLVALNSLRLLGNPLGGGRHPHQPPSRPGSPVGDRGGARAPGDVAAAAARAAALGNGGGNGGGLAADGDLAAAAAGRLESASSGNGGDGSDAAAFVRTGSGAARDVSAAATGLHRRARSHYDCRSCAPFAPAAPAGAAKGKHCSHCHLPL